MYCERKLLLVQLEAKAGYTLSDVKEKVKINKYSYNLIRNGFRKGTIEQWEEIQEILNIPDELMWSLIKGLPQEKK